ncbi:MAG: tRNA (adenosine(37)-N6)-threonylcarbamoyltransferase complex dimerization subunit type 1 TsaB [Planctomycetaceae bacterium]|nr:tRNA (adenosine(37)-N6)-threonylcarbamoyltransferase complex dimerization subunit type 1 TsaB [Planctomycetaceae bacterium]
MSQFALGIETSTRQGEIALSCDGSVVTRSLQSGSQRHAQALVSQADELVSECSLSKSDCDLIAVSIGPGSFTGLRVGVVFAKTLAYALDCQVVAVDTFLAIAVGCPEEVDEVAVVNDAQRSGIFVGNYLREAEGEWRQQQEIRIEDTQAWCERQRQLQIQQGFAITGPCLPKVEDQLSGCPVLTAEFQEPRAANVVSIGEKMRDAGDVADYWELQPFYLRKSTAEERLGE